MPLMDHPFPKSVPSTEKYKRLMKVVNPEDSLAILISADPDAMASAMALKRLFWRKVRRTAVYHVNQIKRADNLAFIRLLKFDQRHIRHLKSSETTRWAVVDSQPQHHEAFRDIPFDIIIDHHSIEGQLRAAFIDIKADYGATSTIMTEYLRAARIRPSSKLATALFYGIKTDTDNFVRETLPNDLNAFRYLYKFTNMNILKKIESSEMTAHTLDSYRTALHRLKLVKDIAYVHMGKVDNPDTLVIIADFLLKLAEATWSVVSGVHADRLIVILRNAGLRGDAGKSAKRLFGPWGGSAGGHRSAARAEVPLANILEGKKEHVNLDQFLLRLVKKLH